MSKTLFCDTCEQPFEHHGGRGRPPKTCPTCKVARNVQIVPKRPSPVVVKPLPTMTTPAPPDGSLTCKECLQNFPRPTGRGRKPTTCQACKNKAESERIQKSLRVSLTSEERVDRLEAMLKSRGTHPSQNEDRW